MERSKEDDSNNIDENFEENEIVKKSKLSKRKTVLPETELRPAIIPPKNVNKKQRTESKTERINDVKVWCMIYFDLFR